MKPPAFLHPFSEPARTEFVRLVSGRGSTVTDEHGRTYLDAIASLWCVNVGHGRPEVIDAVTAQLRALATYNTFGSWTNEPADRLAELVAARAPMPDARVFFTNSGSEAVDTALKLARHTHHLDGDESRTVVISREGGYHGTAIGGTSIQGMAANRGGFGPLVADVDRIERHGLDSVQDAFARHRGNVAAVVLEPVQGASGVHPPEADYLAAMRRLCDDHGALLIFDEVITGFGRLGSWFAGTHYGVEPDLVTFAKGVTSGYIPLGGVIVGSRVRTALEADPSVVLRHGFTYSGHPTAAAAAVACIEVTERDGLIDRAVAIGAHLEPALTALVDGGRAVEVRGVGGIWAIDVPTTGALGAADIAEAMRSAGVLVRPIGHQTLAMCPPLVITDDELDQLLGALREALPR